MSNSIIDFVFGAMTGVAGNAIYESIKNILIFNNEEKLRKLAKNNEKEKFDHELRKIISDNKNILWELKQLKKRKSKNKNTYVKSKYGTAIGKVSGGNITIN